MKEGKMTEQEAKKESNTREQERHGGVHVESIRT